MSFGRHTWEQGILEASLPCRAKSEKNASKTAPYSPVHQFAPHMKRDGVNLLLATVLILQTTNLINASLLDVVFHWGFYR
jgi:hypothetical protein